MSETYNPSNSTPQVGGVTMVEDGDALDAASVRVTQEEHSDAIETLQALVNPGDSDGGAVTVTRSIGFGSVLYLDTARGIFDTFGSSPARSGVGNTSNTPEDSGDAFILVCDITNELPNGATLYQVDVTVAGGTTSAGPPDGPGRLRLFSTDISTGAATPDTTHEDHDDAAGTQAAWQTTHLLECPVSPALVIDRSTKRYWVELRGDYGANVTQSARYLGFRATYSYDRIDAAAA